MNQTISIPSDFASEIIKKLDRLEKAFVRLAYILEKSKEPPYGSKTWWNWSDRNALTDYKKGRYTSIKTHAELDKFLDSLSK